jgi:signal transduction histidine kinase
MIIVTMFIFHAERDEEIERPWKANAAYYAQLIVNEIGLPPNIEKARQIADQTQLDMSFFNENRHVWSSSEVPLEKKGHRWSRVNEKMEVGRYRGHGLFIYEDGSQKVIFSTRRLNPFHHSQQTMISVLIAILIVLWLSYLLVRRLFRPIQWISNGVTQFSSGDFEHRIPIRRKDQLGILTEDVNNMAQEIKGMLDAKREMLLSISHELRSPLARLRVAAEMIENPERKKDIVQETEEMDGLIERILESERLNSSHAKLNRSNIQIDSFLSGFLAEGFSDRVSLLNDESFTVSADPMRLELLLKNLLVNAIQHSPDNSFIELNYKQTDGNWSITVSDSGPGIDKVHLEKITDPFYRPDPARGRKTGGVGLGLYLCRLIVEAHGGELQLKNKTSGGLAVTAVFPK